MDEQRLKEIERWLDGQDRAWFWRFRMVELVQALRAARAALQALRDEISEPAFEDERVPYVEVQISRETWAALKAERERREPAPESTPE